MLRSGLGYEQLRRFCLISLTMTFVCLLADRSHAWTPVDRSFHFVGMLCKDTCVLSFWETCWGEIGCDVMHHVMLTSEGYFVRDSTEPYWNGKSIAIGEMNGYDLAWVQRFRSKDSLFREPFGQIPFARVRPPRFDSLFDTTWGDSIRNAVVNGLPKPLADSNWLRTNMDHPIFEKEVELVYSYPYGVYKNYKISEVIHTGQYFFVLTYQPITTNDVTFDGVLIYRMKGRW